MGNLGSAADYGKVDIRSERQDAVVLEQHHAFAGDRLREGVVLVDVEGTTFGRLGSLKYDAQNTVHSFVEDSLVKFATFDSFHHGIGAPSPGPRHLQVQAALECGDTVVHGAPVRDDIALQVPLLLKDAGEQLVVFRAVGGVDLVVRAHHGPG